MSFGVLSEYCGGSVVVLGKAVLAGPPADSVATRRVVSVPRVPEVVLRLIFL